MNEGILAAIWSDLDQILQKPTIKPVNIYTCNACNEQKVVTREGMVCAGCGLVDSMYIDDTAEWTSGVSEDGRVADPSRCNIPSANHELFSDAWGKGTVIETRHSSKYETKRMAKINFHSSMNHRDRSLFHAYKDIDEACRDLPETVLKGAKTLYKQFNEGKLTRGAVRSGIKANCVLYACRISNLPRTTEEISKMFGIHSKDVSRTTDMFMEVINDEKTEKNYVTKPYNVMQRLLNSFDVNRDDRLMCNRQCVNIEPCVELMSKSPKSVAAAVIYMVLHGRVSKSEVCEKCSVSTPTLNKIVAIVKRYLEDKL